MNDSASQAFLQVVTAMVDCNECANRSKLLSTRCSTRVCGKSGNMYFLILVRASSDDRHFQVTILVSCG